MTTVEATRERWLEAEVYRTGGEIALLSPSPDAAKAKAYFERALDVARQQQAKSWELRAAMSLAGLWRDQGKVRVERGAEVRPGEFEYELPGAGPPIRGVSTQPQQVRQLSGSSLRMNSTCDKSFGRALLTRGFAILCVALIVAAPAGVLAAPTVTVLHFFTGSDGGY